jgi:hypothetical protein
MRYLLAAALMAGASSMAMAQSTDNLEKLSAFKSTGVTEFTFIDQTGPNADAIKATLEKINLPEGFKIELYAIVPDARHMAVGPQGIVTFVGTRKTKVWAVTDRNKDRVADEVKDFAPSIDLAIPNGPCFSQRRLPLYRRAEPRAGLSGRRVLLREPGRGGLRRGEAGQSDSAGRGELQPHRPGLRDRPRRQDSTSRWASPSTCRRRRSWNLYNKHGIGGIIRMNTDGTGARSTPTACATRSAWTSIRPTANCGSPTTRSTAWATTSRRAN